MTPEQPGSETAGVSDAELLRAIAAGDEASFEKLRGRYSPAVARVCRAVARADAEDCEQEVFARVWRKAPLFDPARGSASGWLLTLARRTALNIGVHQSPQPAPAAEADGVTAPHDVDGLWLRTALARLPERERTVLELAYYVDLSESTIARRLRVPVGSVKSWKRRGLNRLAAFLGEDSP
jgi:RNA polymerase sigma-70 factor (ECF subfamily)